MYYLRRWVILARAIANACKGENGHSKSSV